MTRSVALLWQFLLFGVAIPKPFAETPPVPESMERIVVTQDGKGFIKEKSGTPYHPWGMNYGHGGGLMEDHWDTDWGTLETDFHEMKRLGANVARVHLQFGKFMAAADQPDQAALEKLSRLLRLAEQSGLYLDVTGLGSYRPSDVPAWYDSMDEPSRWETQAEFWEFVAGTCVHSSAVFCYDLINEPIVPAGKREPGKWRSGNLFGGYDFVQFLALDQKGRPRDEIAVSWVRRMTSAIRNHDTTHLITVGMLPWSRDWKHLSGFLPIRTAPVVDFISVHLYPDSKKPGEALESLREFAVGKPVVIEETFPLSCTPRELEDFLKASRNLASGWIGHYDGMTPEELDERKIQGKLTAAQGVYREWLRLFTKLKPEFVPEKPRSNP